MASRGVQELTGAALQPAARERPAINPGGQARPAEMAAVLFGGRRGWLHRPSDGMAVRGSVVVCPPIGREQRSAHRALWSLSQSLAASGFVVLRYDHLGAGESAELEGDEALPQWIQGVVEAAALARAAAQTDSLALIGLRIGASLAALAAPAVEPDALMLLAPVTKGAVWLRELEFAAKMAGRLPRRAGEALDADGLLLSPRTVEDLGRLDLGKLRDVPPKVFVAGVGAAKAVGLHFAELGAQVACEPFEGYEELMQEAFASRLPEALFARAEAWLDEAAAGWIPGTPTAALPGPAVLRTRAGREIPVSFGQGLQGMMCLPDRPAGRRAVIFANTGCDPRAGIGGFAVLGARTLAEHGVAALRFDFAGVGDSAFARGWRSVVYDDPRAQDFRAAVDLMIQQGWDEVYLAGVCSGAYHALVAARGGERVKGVFAVNPGEWIWPEGREIYVPSREEVVSSRVLIRDVVKKLLHKGPRGLMRDASLAALAQRARHFWTHGPHRAETQALRAQMRAFAARGGRVRVVVGYSDASLDEMELRFGYRARWLTSRCGGEVRILKALDHGLAYGESRETVTRELLDFVGA